MISTQGEPQNLGGTGSDSGSGAGTKTGMGIDVRKAYALVVGVGEYQHRAWSIPVASRDAEALAEVLGNPTRCGYPAASNIWLLQDDEATAEGIRDGLDWLASRAQKHPDATILVYYSGHGWTEDRGEGQRSYLIGHDTNPEQIADTALPAEDFVAGLRSIQSRRLLVLLDTCHAANMAEAKEGVDAGRRPLPGNFQESFPNQLFLGSLDGISQEIAKDLDPIHEENGPGRAVLASCAGNQKSWFVPGARLSFFTQHLIEALDGLGTPPEEEYVRILDLMGWVSKKVVVSAAAIGREQTPIHKFEGTDFTVARVAVWDSQELKGDRGTEVEDQAPKLVDEAPTLRTVQSLVDVASGGKLEATALDVVDKSSSSIDVLQKLERIRSEKDMKLSGATVRRSS